ncbi:MAG: hypothetical protein ACI9R3_003922 [Verrucomicrobiales bacterium]|jgi:hypothetical protein
MNSITRSFFRISLVTSALLVAFSSTDEMRAQESVDTHDSVHRVETGLRALTSEGCCRRGVVWEGELPPGKRVMLPFFFFKENHYILVIAADDMQAAESTLNIELFDLVGIPIACHTGAGEGRIAIAARPTKTGTCYLSMTLPENSKALKVAIGCAFK